MAGNFVVGSGSRPGWWSRYDMEAEEYRTIYGMGRHNHENRVEIPGYDGPVVLSGDDTFSAPASQIYMYIAHLTADTIWNDEGDL